MGFILAFSALLKGRPYAWLGFDKHTHKYSTHHSTQSDHSQYTSLYRNGIHLRKKPFTLQKFRILNFFALAVMLVSFIQH